MRGEADGAKRPAASPPRATNGSSASPLHKAAINNTLNGSSNGKRESSSTNINGSASPASSKSAKPSAPNFYGHDREEVTRILIQGLSDLGYESAAGALSKESGFDLETPYASAFRMAILQGDWAEAEALLSGNYAYDDRGGVDVVQLGDREEEDQSVTRASPGNERATRGLLLSEDASMNEMLFLIRQQKYLELLERRDREAALMVLRQEIQPLHPDERQLGALSSLMMYQSPDDLKYQTSWDGALGSSRKQLLSDLSRAVSPSVMIPEHRLSEILDRWKQTQVTSDPYHNTKEWPSLYMDHICERDDFPLETICELDRHQNEVWYVQFSNDGSRLATASKDGSVIIYETTTFKTVHVLSDHRDAVAYVAWSPDDSKLVTCSQDKEAKLWDSKSGACLRTIKKHTEPVTSAAWAEDGQSFVTGSFDLKGPLCIWSIEVRGPGNESMPLHNFSDSCSRVQDCAIATIHPSSAPLECKYGYTSTSPSMPHSAITHLIAACTDRSIYIFDYNRRDSLRHIQLDHEITCLSISRDGHEMLLNLNCGEVWAMRVWDFEVLQKFKGQKQGSFVIRSCFGAAREGVVVSGGEDSRICIWHRNSGRLLEQLNAHRTGCVNAVAWNMANPSMFASAGDDYRVRIWSKPLPASQLQQIQSTVVSRSTSSKPHTSQEQGQTPPPRWGGLRGTGFGSGAATSASLLRSLGLDELLPGHQE